jgi:hypothetical protein
MTEQHPGASPYKDRHGREHCRYRRAGRTWSLPHAPGHPDFEETYLAAVTGQPKPRGEIHRMPGAAHPRSLRAAWQLATQTVEWKTGLRPETHLKQIRVAENFLTAPLAEGEALTYGDLPIDQLKRRHVKEILARWLETPHAASHILRLLRKLTGVVLDQEWIETDPTFRISFRPPYKGWKAWPAQARKAFEEKWPLGSTPRTVYALALYQGHRRGDVASIRWSDMEAKGASIVQRKTGRAPWIPMHPELKKALMAAPRRDDRRDAIRPRLQSQGSRHTHAVLDATSRPRAGSRAARPAQDAWQAACRRQRDHKTDHGDPWSHRHQARRALYDRGGAADAVQRWDERPALASPF